MALPNENIRRERGLSVRVGRFEEDLRALGAVVVAPSPPPPPPWPHTLTLTDHAARSSGPLQQEAARRTAGQIQEIRRGFERFVDVLPTGHEGLGGGGGFASALQCLSFSGVHFGPDGGFLREDVARLFGEVVPALLPTLERLRFRSCFLPTDPLVALLQRMSGSPRARESTAIATTATATTARILSLLEITDCSVHTDAIAPHVVELIRSNAPIEFLMFLPNESLGRGACRQIFDGLPHNRHLHRLSVCVERVVEGDIVLPSDPAASSSLRQLHLKVDHWDKKGKAFLARQLQTNTALTSVRVVYRGNTTLPHRPWIDMLERHNFALLSLTEESALGPWGDGPMRSPRVSALLKRNDRIRQALEQLPEYRMAHMARVPHVLEMVNTLPTLLYRFLRRGDVNALVDHLHLPAAARQQQQRDGGGATNKRIRTA
jgi:hypothetical protein